MASSITIGILHSQHGPMAPSERPLIGAALMAVDEINERGGLLGRNINVVVADGASDENSFALEAADLIDGHDVCAIFGCWTSSTRKAVKKVVEEKGGLLWYPIQYEGLEQSTHIVYMGSCMNQQIAPVVDWGLSAGRKRIALVGSDYVFPRTANKLAISMLASSGASVVHESYHPLACLDFSRLVADLRACQPDFIINTLNGQGNVSFLTRLRDVPELRRPDLVCSISCCENMLAGIPGGAEGLLACWGYFRSVDTPANQSFLSRFERYTGGQVASDPIATAYSQVLLWASIVERIGTFAPAVVAENLVDSSIESPLGLLEIQANHHVKRNALIGRCDAHGQFDVLWKSDAPIAPKPWFGVGSSDLPFKKLILQVLATLPDDITMHAQLENEISLHKQLADIMAKNQRRLRETEAIARIGGFERDLKTNEGYWSDALFDLLGYVPGTFEPCLEAFENFVHEEDREGFHSAFSAAVAEGRALDYQCRVVRADGQVRSVQIHNAILRDEHGQVDHYHGTVMDVTERVLAEEALKASEQRMRHLAQTDVLTGMHNRRRFMELAAVEVERASRYSIPFSLIMFDVDTFKRVNDTYGHDSGDVVLKYIADTARGMIRASDILGRLGGEEFAIILPNTELAGAMTYAERLRKGIEGMTIPLKDATIRITISLGVAGIMGCAQSVDSILKMADLALYRAKNGGRNRVEAMEIQDLEAACTLPEEDT